MHTGRKNKDQGRRERCLCVCPPVCRTPLKRELKPQTVSAAGALAQGGAMGDRLQSGVGVGTEQQIVNIP